MAIFFTIVCLILASSSDVYANLLRPQILRIDGQELSVHDSLDLIWWRIPNPGLTNFSKIEYNGRELQPYVLREGEVIFVRSSFSASEVWRSDQEKQSSRKRTGISCGDVTGVGVPSGIQVNTQYGLTRGAAVLLWVEDSEYKKEGRHVTLFLCPDREGRANQPDIPQDSYPYSIHGNAR